MIRNSFIAYIVLSLFLGQTSLPVFTHVCHGMGKTWRGIVLPAKACCGKGKKVLTEQHRAPVQPKACSSMHKSQCCEDHIKCASLSVQVFNQFVKSLAFNNLVSFATHSVAGMLFITNAPAFEGIVHVHGPPVRMSGRDLLIAYQRFLC